MKPLDAHLLRRQLTAHTLNGELEDMSPEFRPLAAVLNITEAARRPSILEAYLGARDDREDILEAILEADPEVAPEGHPPLRFATLADIRRDLSDVQWIWPGYIPAARVAGLAAYEGVGKTRLALDLARRIYQADQWPDGQPPTFPRGTPTLWVCSDGQQDDLCETAAAFGLPDEAVILNTTPEEPYGGTDIDDLEAIERMEAGIVAHRPGLAFVDTLTNATARDLCRANEVKELGAPLRDLSQRTRTTIVLMMHLSREGKALGRRIRGQTRTLLHLDCPDPEHQPARLKLWADKTFAKAPPALGVTMGVSGNTYDFSPPKAQEPNKGGRTPDQRQKARAYIVEELTRSNDQKATDLCTAWEDSGQARNTFWRARDAMVEAGELVCDGKPLIMHLIRQTEGDD
jgi:hypothetical protein